MRFLLVHLFQRLPREGIKSLTVPLLTLVLVVLINLLGAVKAWLEEQYEDTWENFPIIAELSDLSGNITDGLHIGEGTIRIFTDPGLPLSLYEYTGDIALKRTVETGVGTLTGITLIEDLKITFFDGYDESIFLTEDLVCVAGEGYTDGSIAGLTVIGTVSGAEDGTAYAPFWTVSALATEADGLPLFTERMYVTVGDNRKLLMFKSLAWMSFPRVRPIHDNRPFAMTIYDSVFYETLEPLRQNIILVDVATPFIYALSIAVGFLTSVLLTRRRKPEFAVMRSAGVHRRDIFFGMLAEQAVLSTAGAALGCALVAAAWGYVDYTRPAIFLACYVVGTLFSAANAAGTDVLKILRDKE
jgi:hypothetical protein